MITYDATSTTDLEIGTVATHLCDARFALVGNMKRTCVDDNQEDIVGVWSESAPTCERKEFVNHAIPNILYKPYLLGWNPVLHACIDLDYPHMLVHSHIFHA